MTVPGRVEREGRTEDDAAALAVRLLDGQLVLDLFAEPVMLDLKPPGGPVPPGVTLTVTVSNPDARVVISVDDRAVAISCSQPGATLSVTPDLTPGRHVVVAAASVPGGLEQVTVAVYPVS